MTGDPASGDGVNRQFFTDITRQLQDGFDINLITGGEYANYRLC